MLPRKESIRWQRNLAGFNALCTTPCELAKHFLDTSGDLTRIPGTIHRARDDGPPAQQTTSDKSLQRAISKVGLTGFSCRRGILSEARPIVVVPR